MEEEWSCYRRWSLEWRENGYLTEVVSLVKGEWLCYSGDQFIGRRMVMLQRFLWRENGHVTKVVTNGGRMVMLQRWPVELRENVHVTEVVSLMEGERLQRWSLMEGEWSCYSSGH